MVGGRLARATFEPDLMMTDSEAFLIANDEAFEWPNGRVGRALQPLPVDVRHRCWWGPRHVIMGASQIDRFGNQNFAAVGPDYAKPKVQLPRLPRRARQHGETTRRPTGSPATRSRCSSNRSMSSRASVGIAPPRPGPPRRSS